MASVYERITNALSSLGKRRDRDNSANDCGQNDGSTPGRAPKRFRPWEQADLHRRLETYKPLTWFAKPDSVGPVPCALKGWINDARDSLSCEHCNAKLVYPPNVSYDQRQAAADLFSPSLTAKHNSTCPWRRTQCNPSLLAYVPNNTNDELRQIFQTLQGKLLKVDVLPDIDAIAIQAVRDAAAPYGSYNDLMMGIVKPGSITPGRHTTVRISDVTEDHNRASPAPASAAYADGSEFTPSAAAAATTPTYIIQPSKLSPQQKAALLALLGWDIDVLQPDSASGSAAQPYTQSAGYSLQHLGVKPKSASKSAAAAGSPAASAATDRERYPMASVVLRCPHCNCRTGLWNYAGLRPVPTGRLTPAQQAAGAAALLGPLSTGAAASNGSGGGGAAAAAAAGVDPLSVTIAGGQYAIHGAAARPFGATSSAPFRFGSAASTAPVFGLAALDADAQQQQKGDADAGGSAAASGFGSPISAGAVSSLLAGRKRKAETPGAPDPMAVDPEGSRTPPANVTDSKRARLGSKSGAGASPLSPGAFAGAAAVPRELDPLGQHRNWCPWVYTGTREATHMSGWQHMLRALSQELPQQQQPDGVGVGDAGTGTGTCPAPMDTTQSVATPTPAAAVDARQLRDSALAAIRSL